MEGRALVSEALLAGSQSSEVLSSLGDSLAVETEGDTAQLLIAVRDVEVDLVGDLGALGSFSGLREQNHAESKQDNGRSQEALEVEHDEEGVCRWGLIDGIDKVLMG